MFLADFYKMFMHTAKLLFWYHTPIKKNSNFLPWFLAVAFYIYIYRKNIYKKILFDAVTPLLFISLLIFNFKFFFLFRFSFRYYYTILRYIFQDYIIITSSYYDFIYILKICCQEFVMTESWLILFITFYQCICLFFCLKPFLLFSKY